MKVRAANPVDARALSALAQRVFTQTYSSNLTTAILQQYLEHELSPEVFLAEIAKQKAAFFVSEKLAGFIKLEATSLPKGILPNSIELVKLYVDSQHQGSGVGQALMEAGLEWAKSKGFRAVWLVVWQGNPKAVRFYQKHGFEVMGSQEVWVGPTVFQDFLMQKELA